MNRRGMLRFLSLGAISAGTGLTASQAMAHKMPVKSDPDKDGPICAETLQIQSGTKKKEKKKADFNGISFYEDDYEEKKSVAMAVGRDGDLWIKNESGVWKRVVTE